MADFLNELAAEIMRHNLKDTLVLLPNLRSGVALRKILATAMPTGGFLPNVTTLNTWAAETSGLDRADQLELKFWLYDIYEKQMGANAQPISQFFGWADLLISDFSDIDNYLIDPDQIFKNLSQYVEIEEFSFLTDPLSEKQSAYAWFWEKLPALYSAFHEKQLIEGRGYSGLIMSEALKAVKAGAAELPATIFIAGFNALTKSEFELMRLLQDEHGAQVYFELDAAFDGAQLERAAYFVQHNLSAGLGKRMPNGDSISDKSIDIEIWEATHGLEEPLVLNAILSRLSPLELSRTAVVLADERLILPVLSALPKTERPPNITMGIGVGGSLLDAWVRSFCELETARTTGRLEFQKSTVGNFLQETLSILLFENDLDQWKQWLSEPFSAQRAEENPLYNVLYGNSPMPAKLIGLLHWLEPKADDLAVSRIERARIKTGAPAVIAGMASLQAHPKAVNLDSAGIQAIALQCLRGESLAILGDPNENLQITGLLETRSLSYERVIFLSANEENLPAKNAGESFIPFEIRQAYGLPGRREKEAVFAYYFFRLIGAASSAHLVYHAADSSLRSNEKSRYIYQLEYEWSKINPNMRLSYHALDNQIMYREAEERQIVKTPAILDAIRKYLIKGVSASSLNGYADDPVEWYYNSVLRLRRPDAEVDFDKPTYGTLFHKVLELLYQDHVGKPLDNKVIGAIQAASKGIIHSVFQAQFPKRDLNLGEIRLRIELMERSLHKFLKQELSLLNTAAAPILRGTETELSTETQVTIGNEAVPVKVRGNIDRLQTTGSHCEIIDYKTGSVDPNHLKMPGKVEEVDFKKIKKGLQLLVYEYLVVTNLDKLNLGDTRQYEGRIISITQPANTNLTLKLDVNNRKEFFESLLNKLVSEMLDPEIPLLRPAKVLYSEYDF